MSDEHQWLIWWVPTEEGKRLFKKEAYLVSKKPYQDKGEAGNDAYILWADDPAPDKGEFYHYKVLSVGETP